MFSNDKLDSVQKDLLGQRIIAINGEFDSSMGHYVREAMLRLMGQGSPEIKVLINSSGGMMNVGLYIYDAIRIYAGKTTGVVHGFASSMAAIILQGCVKRTATIHSNILIHHISNQEVSLDSLKDLRKIAKLREDAEKHQAKLYAILAARTKHSVGRIRRECAKNRQMTAEEALKFRLIDEII